VSVTSFDLNLFRVLDAVLTEGSVARAARRLNVTPSAVSNALARLRVIIGDRLITKKGRGIVPTPRALELAPVLAKSLGDLQDAVQGGAFNPAATTRRFTIALSDANQVVLLPPIASLFSTVMPRARLRAISIDSLASLGGLAGSEVDVVIGPHGGSTDIHAELLVDQPTVLVCRRDHPIASKPRSRDMMAMLRHVAVDMAPGKSLRDMTDAAYSAAGIARHVVMTVPSFMCAAAVAAMTDFVATVPEPLYESVGLALRLRTIPALIPPFSVPMNLCWHERTHADPAAAGFRELVRRAVATVPAGHNTAPNAGPRVQVGSVTASRVPRGRGRSTGASRSPGKPSR
jgi:DNA-binding transcriptional LysR family regulator